MVKVGSWREELLVCPTGFLAHKRPLSVLGLQHLRQAVDSALGPTDAELVPRWPGRRRPVVGDDHRHCTCGKCLVKPERGGTAASRTKHEPGPGESRLKS